MYFTINTKYQSAHEYNSFINFAKNIYNPSFHHNPKEKAC